MKFVFFLLYIISSYFSTLLIASQFKVKWDTIQFSFFFRASVNSTPIYFRLTFNGGYSILLQSAGLGFESYCGQKLRWLRHDDCTGSHSILKIIIYFDLKKDLLLYSFSVLNYLFHRTTFQTLLSWFFWPILRIFAFESLKFVTIYGINLSIYMLNNVKEYMKR